MSAIKDRMDEFLMELLKEERRRDNNRKKSYWYIISVNVKELKMRVIESSANHLKIIDTTVW